MKVAIVDKCPGTNIKYEQWFKFDDYDVLTLSSVQKQKVNKKDIDLDMSLLDNYDFVVTIGAEPTKQVAGKTSVLNFQGTLVDDKYLPISNPNMFKYRPEGKDAFLHALENIHKFVTGEMKLKKVTTLGIQNEKEALEWLDKAIIQGLVTSNMPLAVDTETSALYPRQGYVLGISLAFTEDEGVYIDSDCITEKVYEKLQTLFYMCLCIFHNAKFDLHMLKYHFLFDFPNYVDTACIHYCLDERQGTHGLKELTIKYTDLGDYEAELEKWKNQYCKTHRIKKADFTYDLIPFDIIYNYAAYDAIATLTLYNIFWPLLEKNGKLFWVYKHLLKAGTDLLLEVEDNGVPFSKENLQMAQVQLNQEIFDLEEKLYTYDEVKQFEKIGGTKLNPNSTAQLQVLLFKILGLPILEYTDKGAASTNAEVLEQLAEQHEIPALLLKIRKLKKIKSTYIDKILIGLDSDNRLRTNFNLITTTSGRLSSSGKLNMQQLPRDDKRVKKCIAARKGFKIVSQDLGTAEMYIAAALSNDKALMDFFRTGGDYHGFMAVNKFGLPCKPNEVAELYPDKRQEAKTVSFEILYKLNLREPILAKFTSLKKWLQQQIGTIKRDGEIYQVFGRKRRLPDVFSKNSGVAQHEIRSGVNALVQGPASDINLLACIEMQKWIKDNGYEKDMVIFAMVHDSILAEVKEDLVDVYASKLKEFTQKDRGVSIPGCPIKVDLEVGDNYAFV